MTSRSPSEGSRDHESAASAVLSPPPEIGLEQIGDEVGAYWVDDDLTAFPGDGRMGPVE